MKPTNAYKYLRIPCNTVRLIYVHVSATLLAALREVHNKGCITKTFLETAHKCKILSFKTCCLRFILKYKINIKFCDKFNFVTHFKTYNLTFVHWFEKFCNLSFLMHPLRMATIVVERNMRHTVFKI